MARDDEAAPDEHDEERNERERADETQFLAHDGEDEVVLRLGEPKLLLIAFAESHTEDAARADSKQALIGLPSAALQVELRVKPCVYAGFGIICENDDARCRRAERDRDAADPLDVSTRNEDHGGAEEEKDDRCGHMLFQSNGAANENDDASGDEESVFEIFRFVRELGYVDREKEHEAEFHDLRWLKLHEIKVDPAACAVDGNAYFRHENEPKQKITDDEDEARVLFEKSVVHDRHADHGDDAHGGPHKLLFDEIEGVTAEIGFGVCVACGGDHYRAEADEQQHDDEKGLIHTAAHAVDDVFFRGAERSQNLAKRAAQRKFFLFDTSLFLLFRFHKLPHCKDIGYHGDDESDSGGEKDDGRLLPAAFFEMMVDGCHFEKALTVGELKITYLQDNRRGLDHVDDTDDKNDEGTFCKKSESCRKSAEKERACVSHEDAGGIPVVNEEAKASAEHEPAEEHECGHLFRKAGSADADGDEKDADNGARRGAKTIDAVRQIHTVIDACDEEHGDRIISDAKIPSDLGEGNGDGGGKTAPERHAEQIKTRNDDLKEKLLVGAQTFILLFKKLCAVIDEADEPKKGSHREGEPKGDEFFFFHSKCGKDGGGEKGGANEEKSSHRRCARLGFMPAGTDLVDRLIQLFADQHGYELFR